MRRIGLFGGTFDPPHIGHLVIAEWALERLRLDRVVFMPTGDPPHKRARLLTAAADRVAMTRLAVRGNRAFTVSTIETRRRGLSYTVDTLRALHARHRGARVFLLMGEDSLEQFLTWREPEVILELATLAVAPRGSSGPEGTRDRRPAIYRGARRIVGARDLMWLDSPVLAISSSQIRRRARAGRSVRYLIGAPVEAYIARHRLYRRRR
jgi:nicotinate-nucleotide adenylyltransferase